jgi:DNA replication protein DnaC
MSDGHYLAMKGISNKKDNRTLVVNIFGGPGSGKSILCASTFSELKWKHITAEMALEYVKDEVWEENRNAISNQLFIFGNQHQRIHRLLDKVDVIIVDSPLLLSILYDKEKNENFKNYIIEKFNSYRNLNIFLDRNNEEFETKGRLHNLEQSIEKDNEMLQILEDNNINYFKYKMEKKSIDKLVEHIISLL